MAHDRVLRTSGPALRGLAAVLQQCVVYLQALTVLALAQLRERDDKIAELEAAAVISRECTTELEENLLAASLLKTRALCVRATWAGRAGLGYPPHKRTRRLEDQSEATPSSAARVHKAYPLHANLAAVGWVLRVYSEQYSGFQTVIVLYELPIQK